MTKRAPGERTNIKNSLPFKFSLYDPYKNSRRVVSSPKNLLRPTLQKQRETAAPPEALSLFSAFSLSPTTRKRTHTHTQP